jgi:predicted nucleotidyltransferase
MIYLDANDKKELMRILAPYTQYDICAYGSRVKGTHKTFSDLDLCIMRPMPWHELDNLKEQIEISNISIFVTIVLWNKLQPSFQAIIERDLLPIVRW